MTQILRRGALRSTLALAALLAPLATTDSILAGITAQNVLKYLLGFGEVAFLLQYNAVTNDFSTRMTYPDPRKQPVTPA